MTTESKAKKNVDYSASAVNLTNNPLLGDMLNAMRGHEAHRAMLQAEADALIPQELKDRIALCETHRAEVSARIRQSIDELGSYQDLETGAYAVKQRKLSKSYKAEPFEKTYPQFAPAVIVKAVDVAKLVGLIKGGLLDEARLEADGVLTITESYAYVIR